MIPWSHVWIAVEVTAAFYVTIVAFGVIAILLARRNDRNYDDVWSDGYFTYQQHKTKHKRRAVQKKTIAQAYDWLDFKTDRQELTGV